MLGGLAGEDDRGRPATVAVVLTAFLGFAALAAFLLRYPARPAVVDLLPLAAAALFYALHVSARGQLVGTLGEVALAPTAIVLGNAWGLLACVAGALVARVVLIRRRGIGKAVANLASYLVAITSGFWVAAALPHSATLLALVAAAAAVTAAVLGNCLTLTAIIAAATGERFVTVIRDALVPWSSNAVLVAGLGSAATYGIIQFPRITIGLMSAAVVITPLANRLITAKLHEETLRAALQTVGELLVAPTMEDAEALLLSAARDLTGADVASLEDAAPAPGTSRRIAVEVPLRNSGPLHLVVDQLGDRRFRSAPEPTLRSLALAGASALDAAASRSVLRDAASRDPLTGLLNRTAFAAHVTHRLQQIDTASRRATVCFIDLDKFKQINDRLGHRAGDQLLRQIADALTNCLRPADALARYGGDEFCLYMEHDASDSHQPDDQDIIGRLTSAVERAAKPLPEAADVITASIGVAHYPDDGADLDHLLQFADDQMYRKKHRTRADLAG